MKEAILITGCASGIGRASTELLLERGERVWGLDLDGPELDRQREVYGDRFLGTRVDVTREEDLDQAFDVLGQSAWTIKAAFNNAGGLADTRGPLHTITTDQWERVLRLNLTAVYALCRREIELFHARAGGVILNTASAAAVRPAPGMPAYAAAKAGVVGLTRAIALDYAPTIRANALCPGTTATPAVVRSRARIGDAAFGSLLNKMVLGRAAEPREIATMAVFLLGEEASFVTGAVLSVDGGWSL
jgi:NAD(P)-dependent dehydrogenase (short-subunit alcohol dehydrogenase family)